MTVVDPFNYSEKDREFTEKLRANGVILSDWRYAELNWLADIHFDRIFEIGGDAMRILVQRENNGKKCCCFVFGPEAVSRLNNKMDELCSLINGSKDEPQELVEVSQLAA